MLLANIKIIFNEKILFLIEIDKLLLYFSKIWLIDLIPNPWPILSGFVVSNFLLIFEEIQLFSIRIFTIEWFCCTLIETNLSFSKHNSVASIAFDKALWNKP